MNITAAQLTQHATVSQEYLLLSYLQRLDRHRTGRRAVHIHLSNLRDHNRKSHHIKIAGNTFEGLVRHFEGQMFALANGDLIFVCTGASVEEMDDAVMRLRFLFSDDPLAILDVADNFSTWYNLEIQYHELLAITERLYEAEQTRQERLRTRSAQWGENEDGAVRPAITPAQLHRLEDFLKSADLSSFVRRQQVCAVTAEARPKRILKEIYVSIDELAATVLPDVNLSRNRWLFQHLTMTLDRRILKLLTRAEDTDLHSSFSMNLNVGTLLSPEFLQFDSELRMGGRGTIVIELQLVDIFADISEFFFARDYLSEKGYRLCIDGVTHHSLPLVDRKALGTDLIKVLWSPAFIDESPDDGKRDRFRHAIERCGKSRVILAHCDSPEAVRFGHQLGITLFQGRFLDTLMQEEGRFGMSSFTL
ncbi:MAG: hypothetical protein GEU87_03065 [Alphaproteobacteria bacterium]|nr:hypothetical protein [Alphaproteobacteria bacterium]